MKNNDLEHATLVLFSLHASSDWRGCVRDADGTVTCRCRCSESEMHMCKRVLWRQKHIAEYGKEYNLYQCCAEALLGADYALVKSASGAYMPVPSPSFLLEL
jgi:hypothetical protein